MTRTGDGDQIEHGERWAAMTPEQKQALEAQRQAAESDLKHLLPRAEPIEDRLERAKIMTPEQWRSLEQMFSLSHVLERHYKECWPAGKSKLKRVVKAISEIKHLVVKLNPRYDSQARVEKRPTTADPADVDTGDRATQRIIVALAEDAWSALDVAKKVVAAWDRFLTERGLERGGNG